ncbi:MAG TPA: DNA ligase D, partial [Anaerolineales bacterium]|nr:DNA ligase D [Anaerolineales bacterium]
MTLNDYQRKRDFQRTPEPPAKPTRQGDEASLRFMVHMHDATRLHWDLRLELDGAYKSWAVPKGPSLDPSEKRLAVLVEDHPIEYGEFEGVIPEGNYGAGTTMIWDEGSYTSPGADSRADIERAFHAGLEKGSIKIVLKGSKLEGQFALVRLKDKEGEGRGAEGRNWLLIKDRDQFSTPRDILELDRSARTGRTMAEIREKEIGRPRPDRVPVDLKDVDLGRAPKAEMPSRVRPMLAEIQETPFDRPGWLFEIKWDGFRAVAEIRPDEVRLYSRNLVSFMEDYPPVVEDLKKIGFQAVLDGEIVAVDSDGKSQIRLLRNYRTTRRGNLVYYVFDLLHLEGHDLTRLPLVRRKEILRKVLPALPHIRFSDHIEQHGKAFYEKAIANGLEGVLGKDRNSPYRIGERSREWLKVKARISQDFVIGGFTAARGQPLAFGALLVGVYEGKDLVFCGRVGTGFDDAERARIKEHLTPLIEAERPFRDEPAIDTQPTWVRPEVVCSISFIEWTDDNLLREPVFLGLHPDRNPHLVTRREATAAEAPAPPPRRRFRLHEDAGTVLQIGGHKVTVTHLDKVYWPKDGYTKGDMIAYYRDLAPVMLPYLADRPLSLHRFPGGIAEKSFYQKDVEQAPEWAKVVPIESESRGETIRFLVCQDEATLVYVANLGSIEIHPWNSRVGNLENPDYMVIDLDPADQPFEQVMEVARTTRAVLEEIGATGYVKTSGATGLHVYVPLGARYDYEQARTFGRLVGHIVHSRHPANTSLERVPASRKGKMYIDVYQNRRGQTLAAPYSIRPRDGAPVSTPLQWEELQPGLTPSAFTIRTLRQRLDRTGDLWSGVLDPGVDIQATLPSLQTLWAREQDRTGTTSG